MPLCGRLREGGCPAQVPAGRPAPAPGKPVPVLAVAPSQGGGRAGIPPCLVPLQTPPGSRGWAPTAAISPFPELKPSAVVLVLTRGSAALQKQVEDTGKELRTWKSSFGCIDRVSGNTVRRGREEWRCRMVKRVMSFLLTCYFFHRQHASVKNAHETLVGNADQFQSNTRTDMD